jgi:uncharacterized protein DUF1559
MITRSRIVFAGCGLFVFVAVCTLPTAPCLATGRESGRIIVCANNMRNVATALQNYAQRNGHFPPAYIADASGKPMHSWRTLLLPYLDRPDLHRTYDFEEPWDSPKNRRVHVQLDYLNCPADPPVSVTDDCTNFVVVTGPGTIFPDGRTTKLRDIKDPARTILLVEIIKMPSDIHWSEPRDLPIAEALKGINPPGGGGICSYHRGGVNVVFANGSLRFLSSRISPQTLKALLTIDGKEQLKDEDLNPPEPAPDRTLGVVASIAVLCALVATYWWWNRRLGRASLPRSRSE